MGPPAAGSGRALWSRQALLLARGAQRGHSSHGLPWTPTVPINGLPGDAPRVERVQFVSAAPDLFKWKDAHRCLRCRR